MRDYPLQQRTIGHLLAEKAAANGTKTCLIWGDQRWSYGEMHAQTNRMANGFAALGIKKSDHVAVILGNHPEFLLAVWGLGKIGAVAVPLNTAAKGDLLSYFLTQSDAKWVIVESEFASRVAEVLPGLTSVEGVISLGDPGSLTGTGKRVVDFNMKNAKNGINRLIANPATIAAIIVGVNAWVVAMATPPLTPIAIIK